MAADSETLLYAFYHLFLPPKLPQQDDYNARYETYLLSITIDGLMQWGNVGHGRADGAISTIRNMQQAYSAVDGSLNENEVLRLLTELTEDAAVPLYVREQNAAVLISRADSRVFFEVFEVSPTDEAIMGTKGRLRRSFPGAAVALDESDFQKRQFQETIAHTLAEMSKHPIEAVQPKVKKAGSVLHEDRDTNHPGMVSELFIGFLRSVGEAVVCPAIVKSMRDDVLWADARSPWRRSPSWLLVRVALQLGFNKNASPMKSDTVYKEAMLFVLAYTLTLATQHSHSSEVLFSMSAKLARRLLKLGPSINTNVLLYVQRAMESAHSLLSKRWSAIQERNSPKFDITKLSNLNFIEDCYVSIPKLDDYITWMGARQREKNFGSFQPPSTLMVFSSNELPQIPKEFTKESRRNAIANLEAFETWVTRHCRKWGQDNQRIACGELGSLIVAYHNLAFPYYSNNPEALSVMLLTIFELWIACDDIATDLCPLLKEYNPGIPWAVLENLLLPFASQIQSLYRIEQYLGERSATARHPPEKIFNDLDSTECFPVKYFRSSTEMGKVYQKIITDAQEEKEKKITELHKLRKEYDDLIDLSNQIECEYQDVCVDYVNKFYESRHKSDCARCRYAARAEDLTIDIHEWPLPQSNTKSQSIVFEKQIPSYLQSWRQARFYVVRDVIKMQYLTKSSPHSRHRLASDPHLPSGPSSSSDIELLSEKKPQIITHRRKQRVSTATESSVCANNGLDYCYFGSKTDQFVEPFEPTEKVLQMCTYRLPVQSGSLQKYLYRPSTTPDGPGSNVVLADPSETPTHMSIEEARDLAMLPLGHRIQLYNLLVQLATPSLNFKKEETSNFIFQCLYQSGPPGYNTSTRPSHAIIGNSEFASHLMLNLKAAWHRIKENWESAQALCIFAAVTARLLSMTSSKEMQQDCIKFLDNLRNGAFAWAGLLRDKFHEAVTHEDRAYFRSKSVDLALICASCFDVEERHLSEILKSDSNASILVQCSIIIREGDPEYNPASELTLACLHIRYRRLLYRTVPILSKTLSGISNAVQRCWSAYRPEGGWRVVCTHWLVSETAPDNDFSVHYDMLSGELLVNGIPLSRPPRKYEDHPMWRVFFGRTPVEVMPTSAPAMEFSAKRQYKGYEVRFGMKWTPSGGSDLLVQASRADIDYETIPSRLLKGLFPDHFINDFVHWYNNGNHTLEFRPRNAPWDSSKPTWIMSRASERWILERQRSTVLGANSETSIAIAAMLYPLSDKQNIHVVLQPLDKSCLEVELPALRLGFFLTAGDSSLRSREFPGMSIDKDQSLATLIGFANKLVLKDENRRLVLVPEGKVTQASHEGHIRVAISKASIVKVHPLYVDSVLGRLTDNGNLQCKLFLSYLHALTSYCLPDPLTNKTGVEQALSILDSAAVRSFDRLSQQNITTLIRIAQLCPKRQYYPQHERVMQTVSWVSNLSCLSHHDGFFRAADEILDQASQMSLFYPGLDATKLNIRGYINTDEFLMSRSRIRTSTFWASAFGAEEHTTDHDITYQSRDRDQESSRGINAYVLSSMVYHGRTTLYVDAPQGGKLWKAMLEVPVVLGPNQTIHLYDLQYSASATNSGLNFSDWPALHKVLSTKSAVANKFNIMIWLSAMAAHKKADIGLLQVLALFFTAHELESVELPSVQSCYPSEGYQATFTLIRDIVRSHLVGVDRSPEGGLRAYSSESRRSFLSRRDRQYTTNQNQAINTLVKQLLELWPRETLPSLDIVDRQVSDYIWLSKVQSIMRQQFEKWFANLSLFKYLQSIEKTLSRFGRGPYTLIRPAWDDTLKPPPTRSCPFISVRELFDGVAPTLPTLSLVSELEPVFNCDEEIIPRVPGLLMALRKTATLSPYETFYIEELCRSMKSLQEQKNPLYTDVRDRCPVTTLLQHLNNCKENVSAMYSRLAAAGAVVRYGVSQFGHGPRVSPLLLLQQLSKETWGSLNPDWKICITRYGIALAALQRAGRLIKAAGLPSDDDLVKELINIGHRTWSPLEHPEWLLLEVESGIMIRDVQERIATEMINPRSNCNAVLQLNMGEGKSSVIVPMVAAEMADGSQLARVIVAKPQSKQMAQMLISKLGGMLNRRVYYMPFSRALKLDSTVLIRNIERMLRDCQNNGGVLLVQPEHLLSFQLMGIECRCSEETGKQHVGSSFIQTQDFFDNSSRDIIDESDENFSPKFELVYTMGSQQSIELSPARWVCVQQVLSLVRSLAAKLANELPKSIEFDPRRKGGFPRLRILKMDAGELLVKRIARHICDTGLDGFPIARQQAHVRDAVFKYISQYNLTTEEISAVEESGDGTFWTDSTKPLLFLIRGILAGGVLMFALSRKRWRVDFGLATDRLPPTKLAVPYRAKDNPTPRSEFSHPDVVIVLTSLTYYYGGLEDEDLFIALGHLMESDQASIEYDAWVKDSGDMPGAFRQLEGINLKDRPQCINDVFPHLKYGKSVIDYFLGHVVFPKEVKEFPYKLSASGWDLGKKKSHFTTGFSGTNDSRKVLPLDMKQLDLPSQVHTNALVLEYLLQPENSVILLPERSTSDATDAQWFLNTVKTLESPVRVILDVGAQIVELNNQQVSQSWLDMVTDTNIQATVFVNDDDELSVIDRTGRVELLQTSSYATRLDTCLVFLDQAHTRGIDLRLPNDYRAAVTLGANLTKDRLVQACMRMRKLGKGQSVVFCVSPEIRDKIQRVTAIPPGEAIGVQHVLHWAISETFTDTERSMPLWTAQGIRFLRQGEFWKSTQTDGVMRMSHSTAMKFLDNEAQSVEARYRPRAGKPTAVPDLLDTEIPRSDEIEERWREFGHLNFNSSTLEEEQERELSPEIEQERQVQLPDPARPADHFLHDDIARFVDTGNLTAPSPAYMPAFDALRSMSAAKFFEPSQLSSSKLFVTNDFARTVHASDISHVSDSYQRPVQWVLSSCAEGSNMVDVLVIISPHEAEALVTRLQSAESKRVALHLYKPRCLTGHRSFDRLDFFTTPTQQRPLEVPRALRVQLNLFAGQLYFDTYEDYLAACEFLGLAADATKPGEVVDADGYILRDSEGNSKFKKSPVRFLKIFTSKIRRIGQDVSKTHVGSMLDGKLLQKFDIEE